ncbi:acrylyl-CoA reductase (NADPH) [Wenxinia marina]|uniref:Putative quinone oxidoreductase, YhdH/YhfP family n=1 Tax=Wenxinia marina DSM 24838 TaxID=1123501 RepID=A0A0D0Q476_9RHOB|nr:MDR family oxidoreductase [Wenxinia marina]KIQ69329.1 putative quinone oxidoreductase, YhdH/YhfP family [Wenxinia marina DSM 24838]GGL57455.1 alcohol dehydrogenase [Wenxinia marina]
MADTFRALVIDRAEGEKAQTVEWRDMGADDLMPGAVTVRVRHTTMNYKDALAITGKSPVVRRFPMIPGIDFAGEVVESDDPGFAPGDEVILNGWGVGEVHMGGYAGLARVRAEWLLKRPDGLTGAECMALGTAGYTAALCVLRLQELGLEPGAGPVLVTGASGGVGSVAVSLLSALGHEVAASTGKAEEAEYLRGLGATEIIDRAELSAPGKPLMKERFAGAVDSVGSTTLANALAQTRYGGAVAACGLAGGMDLPSSVAPFILRGVTLAGVDSVMAPIPKREAAWRLLSDRMDRAKLTEITREASLDEAVDLAPDLLAGKVRGRLLIAVD